MTKDEINAEVERTYYDYINGLISSEEAGAYTKWLLMKIKEERYL